MSDTSRNDVAFATFSVSGDTLDPAAITHALGLKPSLGYRKGDVYLSGRRRQREYTGRTGVWYFSTDAVLQTPDLDKHLTLLTFLLAACPEGLAMLRDMMASGEYEVSGSCFWAGSPGSREPQVLPAFRDVMDRIGGRIEVDFMRDVELRDHADVA